MATGSLQDVSAPRSRAPAGSVAIVTLGCARNEVDSEELAGTLTARGWQLAASEARRRGRGQHLRLHRLGQEGLDRHRAGGRRHRQEGGRGGLPGRTLRRPAGGRPHRGRRDAGLRLLRRASTTGSTTCWPAGRSPRTCPTDRRTLLPISPAQRPSAAAEVAVPGHRWGPRAPRVRLDDSPGRLPQAGVRAATAGAPSAPSRPSAARSCPARRPRSLAEARWLAEHGVRELVLVSENSTSYGKDLGDLRALEALLPELAAHRRHRLGAGLLPAAGRAAPVAAAGHRQHAGRAALLRPVLPARRPAAAAPDEAVRLDRVLPRPARRRPGAGAGRPVPAATSSSASPARPRTTSPSWSGS